MKWLVIVNKKAGRGVAGKRWEETRKKLHIAKLNFKAKLTESPHQTRILALNALNIGYNGIIVYGGDGTISDAASAISSLDVKPLLAFIPTGSGNDWIKSIGFTSPSIDSSISAIVTGKTMYVDSGLCSWKNGSRFFLNSAGIGFDAYVLKTATSLRKFLPLGSSIYLFSMAILSLFPPYWRGTIFLKEKEIYKGCYLSLTVGIGKFSGGGMILAPDAKPNDGLFDSVVLSPMNFFSIVKSLPKIFDGTLATDKHATAFRGETIKIEANSKSSIILELDGEIISLPVNTEEISFSSIKHDIEVIAPN